MLSPEEIWSDITSAEELSAGCLLVSDRKHNSPFQLAESKLNSSPSVTPAAETVMKCLVSVGLARTEA